jgi:hypothetical protein
MDALYYDMIPPILLFPWSLVALTVVGFLRDGWQRQARIASWPALG